jgi:kynurenine formamidase
MTADVSAPSSRSLRRWFPLLTLLVGLAVGALVARPGAPPVALAAPAQAADSAATIKGWKQGKGWGWNWGPEDEVGALNAITPESVHAATQLVTHGDRFDLGVPYGRMSFKWPGHSPCEVMTFRGPEGVKRQADNPFTAPEVNSSGQAWHSCAMFISDNVGTQIDGLGHVTVGDDNHWYNGFKEADWGGNFGVRKCDSTTIPPIVARGVLLDVAGAKGLEALPPHYAITPADIDRALVAQKTKLKPGDVVLIRTGAMRYWGADGSDVAKLSEFDSAGINLDTAKYLVAHYGAMLIGSDTSGLEVSPAPAGSDTFIPVHKYLIIEQGVHIGEFHYLEDLAAQKVYEFCYVAMTNKIIGSTTGFALRPLALR